LELGPEFAAVNVTFVGTRGAEGDSKSDDETEDGEEETGDDESIDELGNAGDEGRP